MQPDWSEAASLPAKPEAIASQLDTPLPILSTAEPRITTPYKTHPLHHSPFKIPSGSAPAHLAPSSPIFRASSYLPLRSATSTHVPAATALHNLLPAAFEVLSAACAACAAWSPTIPAKKERAMNARLRARRRALLVCLLRARERCSKDLVARIDGEEGLVWVCCGVEVDEAKMERMRECAAERCAFWL